MTVEEARLTLGEEESNATVSGCHGWGAAFTETQTDKHFFGRSVGFLL
jgi:hypothetical protein